MWGEAEVAAFCLLRFVVPSSRVGDVVGSASPMGYKLVY